MEGGRGAGEEYVHGPAGCPPAAAPGSLLAPHSPAVMSRLAVLLALALLAPAARAQAVTYQYDGGSGSQNIGPPSTFNPDMLWGNYYLRQAGGEVVTSVTVAFGTTFPSRANPVTVWVLSDDDGDGDPRNARAVARATVPGPIPASTTPVTVQVPPALVGAGFFVGVSVELIGGQDRPARLDPRAPSGNAWVFYADSIAAVIDDLAAAPYGQRIAPTSAGAFLVRATGVAAATASDPTPAAASGLTAVPNPVRGTASLRYTLAEPGDVVVTVVDALGRTVATLAQGPQAAGEQDVSWDARAAAPGVYAARVETARGVTAARVVVVR